MKRVGIIDIGSNSIRLVIFEISKNKSFKIIEDIKESPRLGDGVNETGLLKEKRMDTAFHTLMVFNKICKVYKVNEISAFATAAIRNSKNGSKFLEEVKKKIGMDISIFSGKAEALYSFKGVINSLQIKEGLLMDMGGASTELVWFKNKKIHKWISLNFGAVTISEVAETKDSLSKVNEKILVKYIKSELSNVKWLKDVKGLPLIGVGGTIRNLAKVHYTMKSYPLSILHGYQLKTKDIDDVFQYIKNKSYEEKLEVPGLSKSRADIFIGATLAIKELIKYSNLSNIIISNSGIREGVLYEKLQSYGREVKNVFESSLFDAMDRYSLSTDNGKNIYSLFKKLTTSLKPFYDIKNSKEELMLTICFMGSSGVNINFCDHPIHSYYMILNAELKGIKHKDLIKAALAVSQQEKFNELYKEYSNILDEDDIKEINFLSVVFKISEVLNRILSIKAKDIEIKTINDKVRLIINTSKTLDIEACRVLLPTKNFKKIFEKHLDLAKKN